MRYPAWALGVDGNCALKDSRFSYTASRKLAQSIISTSFSRSPSISIDSGKRLRKRVFVRYRSTTELIYHIMILICCNIVKNRLLL